MMRPIYWIVLVVAAIGSILLLSSAISVRTTERTIYSVSNQDCFDIIETALAEHNTNFTTRNLSIVDAQYINDTIAVVKADNADGQRINFLFEFHNGTLYLTNYSTGHFTRDELNKPDLANYINNAIDA